MPFGEGTNMKPITERKNYRIRMVAARQQLNLSQAELAKLVYRSRGYISAVETGTMTPRLEDARILAKALCIEDYRELEETFNFVHDKNGGKWIGSLGTVIKVPMLD